MADPAVFESCVQEALRLRAAWARAGVDFFQYLVEWEADETRWKGEPGARTGYGTFSEVLHACNIAKPHRLDKFKAVVGRFGLDQVRTIGLEAAEELFRIPDNVPSRREPGVLAKDAAMRDACEFPARNHTTPSTMTAKSIAKQHYEPPPKERKEDEEPTFDDRVKELEHENARLKKELAAKDREIAKLKNELATVRDNVASSTTRKGKRPAVQPAA